MWSQNTEFSRTTSPVNYKSIHCWCQGLNPTSGLSLLCLSHPSMSQGSSCAVEWVSVARPARQMEVSAGPGCSKSFIFFAAPLHNIFYSHSCQSKANRPCAGMLSNAKMRCVAFLYTICLRYRSQFHSGPSSLPLINYGLICKT